MLRTAIMGLAPKVEISDPIEANESFTWECLSRNQAAALLRTPTERHYVYLLLREHGFPFYVGKGSINIGVHRLFQHEAEARTEAKSYKVNIIRAVWRRKAMLLYAFDSFYADEKKALARERYLIQKIGRHDLKAGPLANLTDGGEGFMNPSEESKEAHRQTLYGTDGNSSERAIANKFYQKLTSVRSVPIKPCTEFSKVRPLSWYPIPIGFTPRSAAALAASAIANRVLLQDGCRIPRRLRMGDTEMIIENGAGGAILRSKLAVLAQDSTPGNEIFVLNSSSVDYIVSHTDRGILEDAGVLEPLM
jgi:hypothetical protein